MRSFGIVVIMALILMSCGGHKDVSVTLPDKHHGYYNNPNNYNNNYNQNYGSPYYVPPTGKIDRDDYDRNQNGQYYDGGKHIYIDKHRRSRDIDIDL